MHRDTPVRNRFAYSPFPQPIIALRPGTHCGYHHHQVDEQSLSPLFNHSGIAPAVRQCPGSQCESLLQGQQGKRSRNVVPNAVPVRELTHKSPLAITTRRLCTSAADGVGGRGQVPVLRPRPRDSISSRINFKRVKGRLFISLQTFPKTIPRNNVDRITVIERHFYPLLLDFRAVRY